MKWMFKEDHSVGERGAAGRRVQVKPAFCACLRGRERRGRRGSNVRRTRPCTGRPALCELTLADSEDAVSLPGRRVPSPPRPLEPPSGRWSLHRAAGFFSSAWTFLSSCLYQRHARPSREDSARARGRLSAHILCVKVSITVSL